MSLKQARIAAVVVTYNRKELLCECIHALLAQSCLPEEILVIDNASTDGTRDALSRFQTDCRIVYTNTGSNLGGAGGFSFGIRMAVQRGADFIWVMDDDCIPMPDALEKLYDADSMLGGNYGFLSSKVLWKDGSLCTMNLQRDTLTHTLADISRSLQPVVMASFVSLFLPRSVILELGLPIKEFFIWTDDWEFTRRISRKYPCYAVADSVVVHKSRSNIGANIATESAERLDRFNYLYRNDVVLYRREGFRGFAYEAARLTGHCLRVLMYSPDHKRARLQKIISGTECGLRFHPEIEYVEMTESDDSGEYHEST